MPTTKSIIKFGMYDTSAKQRAVYTGNKMSAYTPFEVLKLDAYSPENIGTLECNNWIFDSGKHAAPAGSSNTSRCILTEGLSDATGALPADTYLQATFAEPHTSIGITIKGDLNNLVWCDQIKIQWLTIDGSLLEEMTFQPDDVNYFASHFVESYYGVRIYLLHVTRPYTRGPVTALEYGLEYIFSDAEIRSGSIVHEMSPISECICTGELSFTLIPQGKYLDILSADSFIAALQSNQVMEAYTVCTDDLGVSKQIALGRFYLDDWSSQDNVVTTFKAVDILGVLAKETSWGGMYHEATVSQVLIDIFGDTMAVFEIADELEQSLISGWIPTNDYRTVLQIICFALGATVRVDMEGVIHLAPLATQSQKTIDLNHKFTGQKLEQRKAITDVNVTATAYTTSTDAINVVDEPYAAGTYTVEFSQPMYSLSATGATILEENVNHAVFQVATSSQVKITGHAYAKVLSVHTISRVTALAGGSRTTITSDSCTLMAPISALYVAQNIYDYYNLSRKVTFKKLWAEEGVGDIIRVFIDRNNTLIGPITRTVVTLLGMITEITVIGYIQSQSDINDFQRVNTFYLGAGATI